MMRIVTLVLFMLIPAIVSAQQNEENQLHEIPPSALQGEKKLVPFSGGIILPGTASEGAYFYCTDEEGQVSVGYRFLTKIDGIQQMLSIIQPKKQLVTQTDHTKWDGPTAELLTKPDPDKVIIRITAVGYEQAKACLPRPAKKTAKR